MSVILHIIILLFCAVPASVAAQSRSIDLFRPHNTELLFAGDVMQHQAQLETARTGNGTYSFSGYYRHIEKVIKKADIAVANLETPIGKSGFSGYPSFCAPDSFLYAIKDAGFDVMLFANNHCLDRGKSGALHTLDLLDSLGIAHCGVYRNKEEREIRYPLIVESDDIRIAILNYTYGTNGHNIPHPLVVNLIDKDVIQRDIQRAREKEADVIIACMHWGDEYVSTPPKRVVEMSHWLIELGVDHIIGNHPHVIQPIEMREETATAKRHAVVYSTGNLVSNMSLRGTDGGAVITMNLNKILNCTRVKSMNYMFTWIAPKDATGKRDFTIMPAATTIIESNQHASNKLQQFLNDSRNLFLKHNKGDIKEFTTDTVRITH